IERNLAYKQRAVLYNATGRTRDGLLGLAFRRDPRGLDNLPARLAYLEVNCDGAGASLYQQSQATTKAALETGRHGLYVDYSEALMGPIIKAYRAEDIINWRVANEGGKTALTMVVLAEEAEIDDGYQTVCVPQWRELLLENGRFVVRLWQRLQKGGEPVQVAFDEAGQVFDMVPRSVGGPLDFIPFQFVGAQSNDPAIDEGPLYDLAYLNRAHYRNSADYEDSVFLAGQPQPWMSGLTEEWRDHLQKQGSAYLGSRAMLMLPQGGAFGIEQAQPNTLAKEAMDQKESQMIALGARLIEASQANRTATESDNDKEVSTSVLSMVCANVSEAYTQAIAWCARYVDLTIAEGDGKYAINQDFARMVAEPQMITALVGAWQSGAFAKTDLRAFLRRLGVIDVQRSDEVIDDEMEAAGPALGMADDEPMAPPDAEPIEPPAPLDVSPIVAAILQSRPEPMDLAALLSAAKSEPQPPIDMRPVADAMRAGMDAMTAVIASMPQPQAPQITVSPAPITVEAQQPIDMTAIAAAIQANGQALATALGTIQPPNVTVTSPPISVRVDKGGAVTFTEDDQGRITGATLN
ncbi:MAG: DUF4055 domain-containing protein, partial [Bosea sp. (in: a-proteobacteria)]